MSIDGMEYVCLFVNKIYLPHIVALPAQTDINKQTITVIFIIPNNKQHFLHMVVTWFS